MVKQRLPKLSSSLDHNNVLAIVGDAKLCGVKALFQRLRDDFLGPLGEDGSLHVDAHDHLHHGLPQFALILFEESPGLLDCLDKDYFQLSCLLVVDLIELLDKLGEGTDEGLEFLLGIEDVLDFVDVLLASERLVVVFSENPFGALFDDVVKYFLVGSLTLVLQVQRSHYT